MNDMYFYDSAFQNMASTGSAHAARRIAAALLTVLPVRGVIDFGCARGTWLRVWKELGVARIAGVDGDYVDRAKLEIDPADFITDDLAREFRRDERFGLAQSLEVAEHLSATRARSFVADFVAHAPAVLFSAATPGQGGEHHVNERPAEYWQRLFAEHDFVAIDCVRPMLARERGIPAWYRYNMVLYVDRVHLDQVSPFARQFQLRGDEKLNDPLPKLYKIRKNVIRALPQNVCDLLARINARRFSGDELKGVSS